MDLVADLIPGTISKFTDGRKSNNTSTNINKSSAEISPADVCDASLSTAAHREADNGAADNGSAAQAALAPQTPSLAEPEKIWRTCLEHIRAHLDAQIFSAWIAPLRLREVTSSEAGKFSVIVAATNKFALDHVQRHYSEYIAGALAGVLQAESLGLSYRVDVITKKDAPPRPAGSAQHSASPYSASPSGTLEREGTRFDGKSAAERSQAVSGYTPANGARSEAALGNGFAASSRGVAPSGPVPSGRIPASERGHHEETNLNTKYNFSNFVVGSCNQFAHAASLRVSEMPGCNYNPLFIYGGVGLGKTHLANAIGNSTRRQNKKALLVSSEAFVSELIAALRSNRMQQFKEKFRSLDLLIIDDIQFIIGKERTQEEFFHTFNDLYNRRKQIVITSDTVPQELAGIEERLRTRFACGLAVDLQAPDLETRVAILMKKAEAVGVNLDINVARYIADAIDTNVRELEGAFNRLQAMISLKGISQAAPVTEELAAEVVRDFRPRRQVEITTELIQRMVSERYNVSLTDLLGKRRTHNVALARQVAMFLCRKLTTYSYPEIGAYFGGRDHSTVIHSYRSIEERITRDSELSVVVEEIQRSLCG